MKQSDELRLKRLAKEREAKKAKRQQEVSESKALTQSLEKLSIQIGEMESISIPEPKDLEPKLEEVNNTLVKLIELMTSGIEIKNIGEAKAKKLEIANQIQIPKDLATNKAIESLVKAIEQNKVVLQAIAKATEDRSQKPEDFIPVRRVYKAGNRFLFDDSSTGSYSGGGGGSSSGGTTNGLTDAQLRATPVPVEGTFYSTTAQYAVIADDVTTGGVVYVGYADPGTATSAASWRIKKIDTSNYPITTWADGNSNFDNVYDNRASLTYS